MANTWNEESIRELLSGKKPAGRVEAVRQQAAKPEVVFADKELMKRAFAGRRLEQVLDSETNVGDRGRRVLSLDRDWTTSSSDEFLPNTDVFVEQSPVPYFVGRYTEFREAGPEFKDYNGNTKQIALHPLPPRNKAQLVNKSDHKLRQLNGHYKTDQPKKEVKEDKLLVPDHNSTVDASKRQTIQKKMSARSVYMNQGHTQMTAVQDTGRSMYDGYNVTTEVRRRTLTAALPSGTYREEQQTAVPTRHGAQVVAPTVPARQRKLSAQRESKPAPIPVAGGHDMHHALSQVPVLGEATIRASQPFYRPGVRNATNESQQFYGEVECSPTNRNEHHEQLPVPSGGPVQIPSERQLCDLGETYREQNMPKPIASAGSARAVHGDVILSEVDDKEVSDILSGHGQTESIAMHGEVVVTKDAMLNDAPVMRQINHALPKFATQAEARRYDAHEEQLRQSGVPIGPTLSQGVDHLNEREYSEQPLHAEAHLYDITTALNAAYEHQTTMRENLQEGVVADHHLEARRVDATVAQKRLGVMDDSRDLRNDADVTVGNRVDATINLGDTFREHHANPLMGFASIATAMMPQERDAGAIATRREIEGDDHTRELQVYASKARSTVQLGHADATTVMPSRPVAERAAGAVHAETKFRREREEVSHPTLSAHASVDRIVQAHSEVCGTDAHAVDIRRAVGGATAGTVAARERDIQRIDAQTVADRHAASFTSGAEATSAKPTHAIRETVGMRQRELTRALAETQVAGARILPVAETNALSGMVSIDRLPTSRLTTPVPSACPTPTYELNNSRSCTPVNTGVPTMGGVYTGTGRMLPQMEVRRR